MLPDLFRVETLAAHHPVPPLAFEHDVGDSLACSPPRRKQKRRHSHQNYLWNVQAAVPDCYHRFVVLELGTRAHSTRDVMGVLWMNGD